MRGSSNAYMFAVHPGSTPSRSGDTPALSDQLHVDLGMTHFSDTNKYLYAMSGGRKGILVLWDYPKGLISPQIWVVRSSAGAVTYVWEADGPVDSGRDTLTPLEEFDEMGMSIVPGGGSVEHLYFPGNTQIDTIETLVEAASLPAWVATSNFSWCSTSTILLEQLFRASQRAMRMPMIFADQTTMFNNSQSTTWTNAYILVWLRQACRILKNIRGESAVELIIDWTVNSDGVVTAVS